MANGRASLMTDELKLFLYPLGYLSSVFFALRFIIQWLQSEKLGHVVVPALFWQLSLAGNLFLLIHSLIQMQYHVALVQTLNGVISWRNLNLMTSSQKSFSFTVFLMFLFSSLTTSYFLFVAPEWFSAPIGSYQLHLNWHLFGFFGIVLFSLRFLVQWWQSERDHQSELTPLFWVMSLAGGLMSLIYFLKLKDPVNALGPALGLIPYIRNLMLIRKKRIV